MEKNNRGLRIIFALILPFSALFYSIKNYRNRDAKWFFVFGLSFLGYTINIEGDIERYRDIFYEMKNVPWSQLLTDILSLKQGDFYVSLVAKFIGIFVENHYFYIAVLIAVFAYFYFSIVKLFIDFLPKKLDFFVIQLFFAFTLFISLRNFISIRFYTATLVFIYGMLKYLFSDKKKYLVFVFISPIIHISFLIGLPFVLFYVFFKKKYKIAFFLMISCYFIGQSSAVDFLNKSLNSNTENAINSKIKTYASEEGIEYLNNRYASEEINSKLLILNTSKQVSNIFISIGILLILFFQKRVLKEDINIKFFTLILVFWALANLLREVSNGSRFTILYLFTALGFFLFLQVNNNLNNHLIQYLKFGIIIVIAYGFMSIVASNVLFKTNYFISNYFVEFFVF